MPFIFDGYARIIKDPIKKDSSYIGVWTDGLAISSDNEPMCAYRLEEGEKYKITIEHIPSEYCGDNDCEEKLKCDRFVLKKGD